MDLNPYEKYLVQMPIGKSERVALILEAIQCAVERRPEETVNEANIRHMEEFFSFLRSRFPTDRLELDTAHPEGTGAHHRS